MGISCEWQTQDSGLLTHFDIACQLLIKTVNYIHTYLGRDEIQFKDNPIWKSQLYGPPLLQRQIDDWLCGLFDLMAMKACVAGEDFSNVADKKKDKMWLDVLVALLTLRFAHLPKANYHPLTPTAGFIE